MARLAPQAGKTSSDETNKPPPPLAPAPLPRAAAAPLWPLAVLALGTVAAFLVAITTNWANLAHLWTQCSSSSSSSAPQLPTQALRFAVLFFQTALDGAARPRREEAVIVGLLAALATVTAVESSSSGRSRRTGSSSSSSSTSSSPKKSGRRPQDASATSGSMTEEEDEDTTHDEAVTVSNNKVLDNLTLVWLLYQLAAGALAWQVIIIPAFLKHEQQQQQQQQQRQQQRGPGKPSTTTTTTTSHENIAIPAGVALGLLVPSTLMLLRPSSTATVLVWLFFPLWVSSIRRIVLETFKVLGRRGGAPPPQSPPSFPSWVNIVLPYVIPVLYSAVAHVLLVEGILYPSSFSTQQEAAAGGQAQARTRSAMLLLEIDHLAIFLAFLYWVWARTSIRLTHLTNNNKTTLVPSRSTTTTTTPVLVTLAATLLLGPGAGVCLGWLSSSSCPWMRSPDSKNWEPELQQDRGGGEASVPAPSTPSPSGRATGTTTTTTTTHPHHGATEQRRARARSSPKATGHFFGGPLAD